MPSSWVSNVSYRAEGAELLYKMQTDNSELESPGAKDTLAKQETQGAWQREIPVLCRGL